MDRRTLLTMGLALVASSVFAVTYLGRYGAMCSPSALGVSAPVTPVPAVFSGVHTDLPILNALVAAGGRIVKPDEAERLRISQQNHLVDGVQCDLKVLDLWVEVGLTILAGLAVVLVRTDLRRT